MLDLFEVSLCLKVKMNNEHDQKMTNAGRAIFVFLHFDPDIFYIICLFSKFASNVSSSGIKRYIFVEPHVPKLGFRFDFLPPRTCTLVSE